MSGMVVDVCICTFRRDSLDDTLRSIAGQQRPPGLTMRVIVADNDATEVRRGPVEQLARTLDLDLQYLHAPARNISVARNACLDAARGDWIAFIDDDEIAERDWLARLIRAGTDQDIVFGVSRAVYAADAPRWIVERDFHSNRIAGNDPAWNGYTANVLIRRAFLQRTKLRFDLDLGQTGGEDTMFFFAADEAQARFGYAPDAVVSEPTPAPRTRLRWLLLRRFRSGQIHSLVLHRQGRAARGTVMAAGKAAWCTAAALVSVIDRGRAADHLLRGALHLGVVAAGLGVRPYREYARPNGQT